MSVCLKEYIKNRRTLTPSTEASGYKFATIFEKPNSLMRKGKKMAIKIPNTSPLNIPSTEALIVRQRENNVVKQPIKITT